MKSFFLFLIFLSPIAAIGQLPNYVPTNGLVAWYPFTGNTNDSSGVGNHGTNNGATLVADRFSNTNAAYSFSGTGYIEVPHSSTLSLSNGSISFWFKTNHSTLQLMILKTTYNTAANENYGVSLNGSGDLDFYVKYNSSCVSTLGWQHCVKNNTYSDNQFHHFVGTIGTDSLRMYIDGAKIAAKVVPNTMADVCAGSPLFIGRDWASNQLYNFKGSLDDIGIWSSVLTPSQVLDLYRACVKPTITNQPTNQSLNIGSNAQMSVTAQGMNVTYQWQRDNGSGFQNVSNAGQFSGATSNTLSITNVSLSNNNEHYRCIITDRVCTDTTISATLSIINSISSISQLKDIRLSNPLTDKFVIDFWGSITKMRIMNLAGAIVFEGTVNKGRNEYDVSHLPKGVYFLRCGGYDGAVKLVK